MAAAKDSGGPAKRPDLGVLKLKRIIVHDVPQRRADDQDSKPVLSEIESPSDDTLRNFIRERVIESLQIGAFDVEFERTSTSPLPKLIDGQLDEPPKPSFVEMSQQSAIHLHQMQTGQNPAGLLVVLRGVLPTKPALGLMKLEREEAIRLALEERGGLHTFNLTYLRDLMLNKKTRVFKTGLFWRSGKKGKKVAGLVTDHQLGRDLERGIANFFLQKFLGCRLAEAPAVVTKRFWDRSERFINEELDDPERQRDYLLALTAEMTSQKTQVQPATFARDHIESKDRDHFKSFIAEVGVGAPFVKDTDKIAGRIKQVQFEFASGIRLSGPADQVDEKVKMEQRPGGQTRVEFEDELTKARGKGR
ncbi:MAG: nucleoid-associated protein [Actinomycetota bacterium]